MVDGLKPGQHKVLFACFKRTLRKEIKVGLTLCRSWICSLCSATHTLHLG